MKNVLGEVIYETQDEKLLFYDYTYNNEIIISKSEFLDHRIPVKDDYFNDVLIPFCLTSNIKSVLDVGAEHGRYSAKFANIGCTVTALEISPGRFEHLKRTLDTYGYGNIKVLCGNIEEIVLDNYDFIFCSDVIEHLEAYEAVWSKCVEHSKYIYALIPKEDSWNWSVDHIQRFDDKKICDLILLSKGLVSCIILEYDDKNSWYTLIVRGLL